MAKFSIEFVNLVSSPVPVGSSRKTASVWIGRCLLPRAEAVAGVVGFQCSYRQLDSDEASERLGLARMNGEV